MPTSNKPNRLASEKSPYLLQHAYNPVDWFPWSDEAFHNAVEQHKPIFLSIGYSTCHWCHVMERESFEDETVAHVLNEHFVSIKVDREERPDVDHLYMTVCQALTGHGGWPLTIIMTPDKKPFFAGTYFPRERKYGRAGLLDILHAVRQQWEEAPEKLTGAADAITEQITSRIQNKLEGELSEETLRQALRNYKETFDNRWGGFGDAPKFPTAHNLSLLLRLHVKFQDSEALNMAEKTLEFMHRGGMYDHIGFGFARYSTDERWLVPHFEKMLYDNALLATAYIEAYLLTAKPLYAEVAKQIFTYVLRDMTDPNGGFYSAEDADSEGVEGKFYVWSPDEVIDILGEEDGEAFCSLFDITPQGNFEGRSIPNLLQHSLEDWARLRGKDMQDVQSWIEECRQKLFAIREKRVHPSKDDKILTSWNGLMIAAFAQGYKAFGEEAYLHAAARAAAFIEQHLTDASGRLLSRYRDGEAKYAAYLDDYACYIYGLLELYEATFDADYLERALSLYDHMEQWFWDEEDGGFYFYASDSEQLWMRMKEVYDGAMPSGNSVAAYVMQRLAHLTGDKRMEQRAEQLLQAVAGEVSRYPNGYAMFMHAVLFAIGPTREIVLAGEAADERVQDMISAIRSKFLPQTVIAWNVQGEEGEKARQLMSVLQGKSLVHGQAATYICENFTCQSPITDVSRLHDELR